MSLYFFLVSRWQARNPGKRVTMGVHKKILKEQLEFSKVAFEKIGSKKNDKKTDAGSHE